MQNVISHFMGRQLIIIILTLILISCDNNVSDKKETVRLQYVSWGCECANWADQKFIDKYVDFPDSLTDLCVFIEPAGKTNAVSEDTMCFNGDVVEFTGSYYKDKGYPKDFHTEQPVDKAKIFKYDTYKIIRSNRKAVMQDRVEVQLNGK